MHELDEQLRELIPRLRRFAVSLTRNASSADDLVQSTLERGIISWADKRIEGDLRAWLFSILYRQFLDAHRRTRRYARMLEFFTGRDDVQPSVERTVIAQSTLQAFDQLSTEQRALLGAELIEGLQGRLGDHRAFHRRLHIVASGEELQHACVAPGAAVGIEELSVEDREQPGAQVAFDAFIGPTDDPPLQGRLHQVVGAAGVAGQGHGKAP